MQFPFIPDDAPFNEDQRAWLTGFMAGMSTRLVATGTNADAAAGLLSLDILVGTQTGNAQEVADDVVAAATEAGLNGTLHELDDVDLSALAQMERVLIVTSTYGEGEMPDNAELFWEALKADTAPRMEKVNFAVLGLGDTSYDGFCSAAKDIDSRLNQLGANRVMDGVWLDVDYEDAAEEWVAESLSTIKPFGDQTVAEAVVPVAAPKREKSKWNRKTPYPANVAANRLLSGEGSAKEIRHFEFDLGDSGINYAAGDALAVMPVNNPQLVDDILDRLGVDAGANVGGEAIHTLLTNQYEILTPSKDFIWRVAEMAGDDHLSHIRENDDKEALDDFLWNRDTLDVMLQYDKVNLSAEEFVSLLRPLQHRAYSISSSPKEHPDQIHLTIGTVRWKAYDRHHGGVASTFLADRVGEGGKSGVFLSENKAFRPPADTDAPMIMVGPGTGIAPFRAFLQDRRADGAQGKNWLFFGDQTSANDFIYADELAHMQDQGVLHRLDLAFSRDQKEKVYVQHKMAESGKDLFAWLEEGGYFYVCGDAVRMAKDVDEALHEIIAEHGALSNDGARDYVANLKREKRYLRDVY
ncbi:MAG: sulfite reductase subunit alpha [Pseudomonadota bacterium]